MIPPSMWTINYEEVAENNFSHSGKSGALMTRSNHLGSLSG